MICNFRQFEIWRPGSFPDRPVASFELANLPDRYDALGFLAGPNVEASFSQHYRELTQEADRFPGAIDIVKRMVKPEGGKSRRKVYREKWWMFAEPRTAMRRASDDVARYGSAARQGKRLLMCWTPTDVLGSDATEVFAFDDDYSMGVLLSRAHDAWAWAQASTLETRLRYTPSSVFETFPWPDPATDAQRDRVAEASRQPLSRRTEICSTEQIGLTRLYSAVDDGAWADLLALHRDLDEAVADCYGWPRQNAQNGPEIVRRLTELNRSIIEGRPYAPFAD